MTHHVNCPTCGKQVEWNQTQKWRPFCCERCRLIDLGEWAGEGHRIAGRETIPEEQVNPDNKDD
ncbi:MAG: DNA gyrase inhibitor YacG [Gammaproteobacteria bacterium]|nr:DNA gyrase inhibitor YacG [Gammaproteobacteria bacterium]MDH5651504.1 DNA gyrase inhibitor YacG [Gammaproteobacteria bacterium]